MPQTRKRTFDAIAKEVKQLHDLDERLNEDRQKNLEQQRDVRLKIGRLVAQVAKTERPELARRSGFTVTRLRDFERTALAWPEESFPPGSHFTALEELRNDPGRFELIRAGMSKRDARAARGGKGDTPLRWSPDQAAQTVTELMQSNPRVGQAIAHAVMEAEVSADAQAYRRMSTQHPSGREDDDIDEVAHMASRAKSLARRIDAWTEDARDLSVSQDDKDYLLGAVEEMVIAAIAARNHINASDDAFAALLSEEGTK